MYRKILSWMLILCLCMGIMPGISAYAAEDQGNSGGTVIIADGVETEAQSVSEEMEAEIPQNGSKVHMEGATAGVAASGRRLMKKTSNKRYTVLVLDDSFSLDFLYNGSLLYTANTALPYVKEASKEFVEDMGDASGENYIAIVCYGGNGPRVVSPFTNDTDALIKAIDALYDSGGSNVCGGLAAAERLIDSVSDQDAVKNVVLFTTGMTNSGTYSYTGKYSTLTVGGRWAVSGSGVPLYAYANAACEEAESLKEKCTVYSIGLFQTLKDMPEQGREIVSFFKLCACDWASSKNHFYDVKDPADLDFVFGQVADNIVKRTGRFSYPGGSRDHTAVYYYDDNYFKGSSYEYDQHLATMSLCLELSAWESAEESDYARKMKNAENLLDEIGFVGFDHNYTDFMGDGIIGKPTMDSVGVVAANKLLSFDGKDYTLIAVAIRGGGYEREWASNFTLGKSGEHLGFSQARDIVTAFLEDYVREQGINGDLKIWITGYSRAAATANMVAAALDDGVVDLGGCSLRAEDIFAYTFETPAGTVDPEARNKRYSNIFNIINQNDPVTKVAPLVWKFDRYGMDIPIPSPEVDGLKVYKESAAAMLERYREMEGYPGYIVDDFQMKKVNVDFLHCLPGGKPFVSIVDNSKDTRSQSQFLDDYITIFAKEGFRNRKTYAETYQDGIRYTLGVIFSEGEAEAARFFDLAEKKFSKDYGELLYEFFKPFGGESDACRKIIDFLNECLNNAGITRYSPKEFGTKMYPVLYLASGVAEWHPYLTTTLVMNLSGILQAHYPELCLAWMQSMDTNYTTNAKLGFSSGKYRVVRINCPIDVTVYDTEGNVLAAIIDDTPQPDGHVVAAFTAEGEKLLYLPVNHDYIVQLTATDDGVMNYGIQEYDPYAGEANHLIFFHDIEVTEGQKYTAYLPRYSEEDMESMTGTAADTDYTLFLGSTEIMPSEELTGEEVFSAYYEVSASAEDASMGLVFGAGIRQYGSFIKLEALSYDGYEFVGWYEGDDLVSAEAEYRFRVSKDIELVAVFQESSQGKTPEGGTGDGKEEGGTGDGKEEGGTGDDKEEGGKGTNDGMFRVTSHWNSGFIGEITLTNTTDEVIHDWAVDFVFPYEIINIWNGVVASYENGICTVQNAGYNRDIQPGESVTFGFGVNVETETITEPTDYRLHTVDRR